MLRVRLLVAYDGTPFSGFARNDPHPTVGGLLEDALAKIFGSPISVTCAGRTDKGVHAWGQVVTFDVPVANIDPTRLRKALDALAGPHVVVREVSPVERPFDARFSARWRRYRYTVLNRDSPDPFARHVTWWVPEPLSLAAMCQGAIPLVGEHDFTSFCRRPKPAVGAIHPPSMVRRVLAADWKDLGDGLLRFEITSTAFCHQMVRSIVGTLVDVGRGRLTAADVARVLGARDRSLVPNLAPPAGLCLWEVGY